MKQMSIKYVQRVKIHIFVAETIHSKAVCVFDGALLLNTSSALMTF
jgi:hypothetical protein